MGYGRGVMPALKPIAAPSLVALAYDSIRRSILSGATGMGERLNEVRLAEQLGVSRGPVREALKRLQEEGLVVERPRQSMTVRTFTARDVADVYEVRMALEALAARLLVRRKVDLAPLVARLSELDEAVKRGDVTGANSAEFAFHEDLCQLSGNQHLADTYRAVNGRIQLALAIDNSGQPLNALLDEHAPLLDALELRDENAAATAVQRHIVMNVRTRLERLGFPDADLLEPPF